MSKYVSDFGLPYGVHHRIDGHNGLNGRHHFPHVHFEGKGTECVFKINPPEWVTGSLGNATEKEIKRWILSNQRQLNEEWDAADDPKGGRF